MTRHFLLGLVLALQALTAPLEAQLARGILRGPLVVTSGGTPSIARVGSAFTYNAASTTTAITVTRPTTVNVVGCAPGGGGKNADIGAGHSVYGGGGGGGGSCTNGTSVTLVPGVTYQVITGAVGAVSPADATAGGDGGTAYFRIAASTIYVQLGGGGGAAVFNGSVYPGGAAGVPVTGSNLVAGGAGGAGGNGGLASTEHGVAGSAPNGAGGGGNGFIGPAGNGGTSGSGAAGGTGGVADGLGGAGGSGGNGGGGAGMGGNAFNATAGRAGTFTVTVTAIF